MSRRRARRCASYETEGAVTTPCAAADAEPRTGQVHTAMVSHKSCHLKQLHALVGLATVAACWLRKGVTCCRVVSGKLPDGQRIG